MWVERRPTSTGFSEGLTTPTGRRATPVYVDEGAVHGVGAVGSILSRKRTGRHFPVLEPELKSTGALNK